MMIVVLGSDGNEVCEEKEGEEGERTYNQRMMKG
jgi:hypothetical protein